MPTFSATITTCSSGSAGGAERDARAAGERSTLWTAPQQAGTVPVTVTCPSDNKTASDTVNIQVTRQPVREYTFEDVSFDFDRYSLRPEATRVLDEAIAAAAASARIASAR